MEEDLHTKETGRSKDLTGKHPLSQQKIIGRALCASHNRLPTNRPAVSGLVSREHLRSAELVSEHSGSRNASPTEDQEEDECTGGGWEVLLG